MADLLHRFHDLRRRAAPAARASAGTVFDHGRLAQPPTAPRRRSAAWLHALLLAAAPLLVIGFYGVVNGAVERAAARRAAAALSVRVPPAGLRPVAWQCSEFSGGPYSACRPVSADGRSETTPDAPVAGI